MTAPLLVLNAGSSSVKFALYDVAAAPLLRLRGQVQALAGQPQLALFDAQGATLDAQRWPQPLTHAQAFDAIRARLAARGAAAFCAVGHRVVHGGTRFAAPVRIDDAVLRELEALVALAPLHQPHALALIRAVAAQAPTLPQVACFDTAFHRTLPEVAQRYALPQALHAQGIQRYGFHGLSYASVAQQLQALDPEAAAGRVVIAHLGAGASLAALHGGRSVDTTMGFTPLEGLPMATRSGSIDPGVLLHLLRNGWDATQLERLLTQESGLLGVSGESGDLRALRASGTPAAVAAIDLFVYRIVRETGALAAALGGLDALVFTAGIGEHDAALRAAVCRSFGWLGLALDDGANAMHATRISRADSRVAVLVIPTDEESLIAGQALAALG